MSQGWLGQVVDEVPAMAAAEGISPEVVATMLHTGRLSLDHVPGRTGFAAAATIISQHLPLEIREAERIEREHREAEEGRRASRALIEISERLQTWQALPEAQRLVSAADAKRDILVLAHRPVGDR